MRVKSKPKKKIDKKKKGPAAKKITKTAAAGGRKEDGLGSAAARSKNAKWFSAFLPTGGFSMGLGSLAKSKVKKSVLDYENYHKFQDGESVNQGKAKAQYTDMVNKYYDLATSFYEYAWGDSFHFAHRLKNETLRESIKRHEHFLASKFTKNLKTKKGERPLVLDVGCGIGGPAREISSFCGVDVVGLNNNAYQVERAKTITTAKR